MNPEILDLASVALPQLAVYIVAAKGVASVLCNNLPTQNWGKLGVALEWLASNNKEAKKTGDSSVDEAIDLIKDYVPKKTVVGRVLNFLS